MGIPTGRSDIYISIHAKSNRGCVYRSEESHADGHAFIDKALTRGAVAVVCEQLPENKTGRGNLYMDCRYLRSFGGNGRELLG